MVFRKALDIGSYRQDDFEDGFQSPNARPIVYPLEHHQVDLKALVDILHSVAKEGYFDTGLPSTFKGIRYAWVDHYLTEFAQAVIRFTKEAGILKRAAVYHQLMADFADFYESKGGVFSNWARQRFGHEIDPDTHGAPPPSAKGIKSTLNPGPDYFISLDLKWISNPQDDVLRMAYKPRK